MREQTPEVTVRTRYRWLPALLGSLFLLQMVAPSRAWVALLVTLGGALGLGYLWAQSLARRVRLTRQQRYGWVHAGDLLEERFELHNDSPLPALWIEIDDESDLPGYSARSVRSADGHGTLDWRSEGVCRQRGLFRLGPWQARAADPLGFFEVSLRFPDSRSILVYPAVVHLPKLILAKGVAAGAAPVNRPHQELTTNAAGVRGYAPGDSLSHVHWRSTARRDSLMVKTFDLEPSGDLWILLDLDQAVQAGQAEESTEEYGVILAASLADRWLKLNRAVGLIAFGSSGGQAGPAAGSGTAIARVPQRVVVPPQKGQAQRARLLEALAMVHAGGDWPLARVLAEADRSLGRGVTLSIITPSCDATWLGGLLPPMRRGVAPTVILLDPASFGGGGDARALTGLLADLGVPCQPITRGMPFELIERHRRVGPPEYRVLPGTGRVIALDRVS